MDFELKISEEDTYDNDQANALVGKIITIKGFNEVLIKDHVLYHFFVVSKDGSFRMLSAKNILDDIKRKEDNIGVLNNLKKLFNKQYLKDATSSIHGYITYYADIFGTGDPGVNTLLDNRAIVFDTNGVDGYGQFGIQVSGYSSAGDLSKLETEAFVKIPDSDIRLYALNEFKIKFENYLSLDNQIFYSKNEKNGSIAFWNSNSEHAFLFEVFSTPDDWGKEFFTIHKGIVKNYPDAKNSGIAQSGRRPSWGRKITMSKNAQFVDKSLLLEPIYEIMAEKIDFLFNAKKQF